MRSAQPNPQDDPNDPRRAVRRRGSATPDMRDNARPERRVEERPAAAMVLAPVLGAVIWGGLAALVFL